MAGETSAPFTYYVYDAVDETLIGEAPFASLSFNEVSNRPGGWDGALSVDHPFSTRANLEPLTRVVYIDRGGLPLFGGWLIAADAELDAKAGGLKVGGEGLWAYYRDDRRRIRSRAGMTYATGPSATQVTFTGVDVFRIVADLLAHASATSPASINFAGVRMHGPGGSGLSGVTKDVTYFVHEQKNIGDAVEELAAQSPGFDFSIGLEWSGGVIRRYFDLWYPRRGVNSGALIFEDKKNVNLVKWSIDGSRTANRATANGAGTGDALKSQTAQANDLLAPAGAYPLLERSTSYRDEAIDANLLAHALADLSASKLPVETATVELHEGDDASLSTFGVGDTARLIANRGFVTLDKLFRVEARKCSIDENGKAKITVDLADEAASLGTA